MAVAVRVAARAGLGAGVALLLATACGGTYYDQYRAAHPDWESDLPNGTANLEQVVAALHAPDGVEGIRAEVLQLELLELGSQPWRTIPLDALRRGSFRSSDSSSYAVIAVRVCQADEGLRVRGERRIAYYLLVSNRLVAFDHYAYRGHCAVVDVFRAARGNAALLEAALASHISEEYGRRRLDLSQIYRRGFGYVEAGRLAEAHAVLRVAERGYREATLRARQSPVAPPAFEEATRLREKLHRALGLEAPKL